MSFPDCSRHDPNVSNTNEYESDDDENHVATASTSKRQHVEKTVKSTTLTSTEHTESKKKKYDAWFIKDLFITILTYLELADICKFRLISSFHYQNLIFELKGRPFDEKNQHTVVEFKTCNKVLGKIICNQYGQSFEVLTKWYCKCINFKCECKRFHVDSQAAISYTPSKGDSLDSSYVCTVSEEECVCAICG